MHCFYSFTQLLWLIVGYDDVHDVITYSNGELSLVQVTLFLSLTDTMC